METIQHYISQVLDGLKVSTDDTTIYQEMVYNELRNTAIEMIRQETDKGRLDESNAQPIFNFELHQVDISECDSFQSGKTILKSKKKLPKIIDNETFGKLIFTVYTNTGTLLEFTTHQRWVNQQRKIHTMRLPSYLLRNDHLFVVNYDPVAPCLFVNLQCFPEDPVEVEMLSNPCAYIPELPFYLPRYIARRVVEMTRVTIMKTLNIAPDVRGNAKEEITPSPQ
jgi:hypothetical protein